MTQATIYPVSEAFQNSWMSEDKYQALYHYSLENPEAFWGKKAERYLDWYRPWDSIYEGDFNSCEVSWFKGGQLNASVNCIDRHLENRADRVAIIWEGDTPDLQRKITYQEIHDEVCKLANGLKERGSTGVTGFVSTCPWYLRPSMPCLPVHALARFTP